MAKYETFLFLLVTAVSLTVCVADDETTSDSDATGDTDSTVEASSTVSDLRFSVSTNSYSEGGACIQQLSVQGEGVADSFEMSCTEPGFSAVTTPSAFVYGDPKDSPFSLYSDKPATLIVILNGKCTQKSYTTTNEGTTSTSSEMSDEECTAVKQKMADELEKNRQYWEEWNNNLTTQMDDMYSQFGNQPGYSDDSGDGDYSGGGGGNSWGSFASTFGFGNLWGGSGANNAAPSGNGYGWSSEDNSNDDYSN